MWSHDAWGLRCAGEESGRAPLAYPWIREAAVYASDGVLLVCGPRELNEATLPERPKDWAGPPATRVAELLLAARAIKPIKVHLWSLMCWAGPLGHRRAPCLYCEGLGTIGFRCPTNGGVEWVGPSADRAGQGIPADDCPGCDGACRGDRGPAWLAVP